MERLSTKVPNGERLLTRAPNGRAVSQPEPPSNRTPPVSLFDDFKTSTTIASSLFMAIHRTECQVVIHPTKPSLTLFKRVLIPSSLFLTSEMMSGRIRYNNGPPFVEALRTFVHFSRALYLNRGEAIKGSILEPEAQFPAYNSRRSSRSSHFPRDLSFFLQLAKPEASTPPLPSVF